MNCRGESAAVLGNYFEPLEKSVSDIPRQWLLS